jgi:hypothetical protein
MYMVVCQFLSADFKWPVKTLHIYSWVRLQRKLQAYYVDPSEEDCYTRSTPSYKLLSKYNLILTQWLTSYPQALVQLSCGSYCFARVTKELPKVRLWLLCVERVTIELSTSKNLVALRRKGVKRAFNSMAVVVLRRGHLALLVGRLSSVVHLSLFRPSFLNATPPLV